MKRQLTIMLLAGLLALPVSAARRRSAVPVAGDTLSIVFVGAPAGDGTFNAAGADAWLDVRDVAHPPGSHSGSTHVVRRFGIRIVRTTGTATGTATIQAHLESSDGRASIRLDGILLTENPVIIDSHAAIGSVVFHTLQIEVSDSVTPGPIASAIAWDVLAQ